MKMCWRMIRLLHMTRLRLHSLLVTFAIVPGILANGFSFQATRDATLYEASDGGLSNGGGEYLFVGSTGQSENSLRRALVAFDDALVPDLAILRSAELSLTVSKAASGEAQEVSVHRMLTDWSEGTANASGGEGGGATAVAGDATWLHSDFGTSAWTQPGGDFVADPSATITVSGTGTYTWGLNGELLDDVQFWSDNPAQNYGWAIIGSEADSRSAKRFDSRTSLIEATRPTLKLMYSPEPATSSWIAWLGLIALRFRYRIA